VNVVGGCCGTTPEHIAALAKEAGKHHATVYQVCLLAELRSMGLRVQEQVAVPIVYRGERLANDLRIDLLVENRVIVEIKAVEELHPIHTAQLLTYLKADQQEAWFAHQLQHDQADRRA
jgi:GxxExxY protein